MDDKQQLDHRQFAWMIGTVLTAGTLMVLPHELADIGGMDAWFAYFASIFYAFLIAWFFAYLIRIYPGKNLIEIVYLVMGKWVGALMTLAFIFLLWIAIIRNIRLLSIFFQTALLPRTPEEAIILVFVLVLIYYGRSSVEVTARVNDLIWPIFFLMIIALPILLSNELSLERIEPILVGGVAPLLKTNLLAIGWGGDLFLLGAFLHTITQSNKALASMRHGIIMSTVLLTTLMLLCLTTLGSRVTARSLYPSYTLIQQIHITDFLDRIDIIVFSVWLPISMIKLAFLYHACLIALKHLSFKTRLDHTIFNKSFGLFLFITAFLAFKGLLDAMKLGTYGSLGLSLIIQPIFCISLLITSKIKHSRHQKPKAKNCKYRFWQKTTLTLLVGALFCILAGLLYGNEVAEIGLWSGMGYLVFLFLGLMSSYMELKKAKNS